MRVILTAQRSLVQVKKSSNNDHYMDMCSMRNVDDEEQKKKKNKIENKWRKWMFDMVMEYI